MKTTLLSTVALPVEHNSEKSHNPSNAAQAPRSITAGLLTRAETAADLGCSERTVIRRERAGMPFIKLGMLRLYDPVSCRAWLMAHEHRHDTPKRGRPANKAA